MKKSFKSFVTETPSYEAPLNPAAGGVWSEEVISKINALMGAILKEDVLDSGAAIAQVRNSLSRLSLTFPVVEFTEDAGTVSVPLTANGGRFGKDVDTPHDQFMEDDGISHMKEGGLSLEFVYEKTEHSACRIRATIK